MNCAALPTELLESELFGYEKGAFTGAVKLKPGKFEFANKGTIFLDEIGEMSLAIQAKLLQVLQDGEFARLGGKDDVIVDVRVIAATNKDLEQEVRERRFREDLFYRLNVVNIHIPPVRERPEEIPVLAKYFFQKYKRKYNKNVPDLSESLLPKSSCTRPLATSFSIRTLAAVQDTARSSAITEISSTSSPTMRSFACR